MHRLLSLFCVLLLCVIACIHEAQGEVRLQGWREVVTRSEHPEQRSGHSFVTVAENKLFLFGGRSTAKGILRVGAALDELRELDTENNMEWKKHTLIRDAPAGRYDHSTSVVGDKMVVLGGVGKGWMGFGPTYFNDAHTLDLSQMVWRREELGSDFPARRGHSSTTISGDTMIVFGGTNGVSFYNDLYSFNVVTRAWTRKAVAGIPPHPRAGHSAVFVDNIVWFFGGENGETRYNDIFGYDTTKEEWVHPSITGAGPQPRSYHSASRLPTMDWIIYGGFALHDAILNDMWVFRTATNTWEPIELVENTRELSRAGHKTVFHKNRLYMFGGDSNPALFSLNLGPLTGESIVIEQRTETKHSEVIDIPPVIIERFDDRPSEPVDKEKIQALIKRLDSITDGTINAAKIESLYAQITAELNDSLSEVDIEKSKKQQGLIIRLLQKWDERERLLREIAGMTRQIDDSMVDFQRRKQGQDQANRNLNTEKAELEDKFQQLLDAEKALDEVNKALAALDADRSHHTRAGLQKDRRALQDDLIRVERLIDEADKDRSSRSSQLKDAEGQLLALPKRIQTLQDEIGAGDDRVATLLNDIDSQRRGRESSQERIQRYIKLRGDNRLKEEILRKLQELLRQSEEQSKNLTKSLEEFVEVANTLPLQDSPEARLLFRALMGDDNEVIKGIADMRRIFEALLKKIMESYDESDREVSLARRQIVEHDDRIKQFEADRTAQQEKNAQHRRELKRFVDEREALEKRVSELTAQVEALQVKRDALNDERNKILARIMSIEDELKKVELGINKFEEDRKRTRDRRDALAIQIKELQREVNDRFNKLKSQSFRVEHDNTQLDQRKKQIGDAVTALQQFEDREDKLNHEIQAIWDELTEDLRAIALRLRTCQARGSPTSALNASTEDTTVTVVTSTTATKPAAQPTRPTVTTPKD